MPDGPVADDTNPLVPTPKFWVPSACVDDGALGSIEARYVKLYRCALRAWRTNQNITLVVDVERFVAILY
jgi:hypothetical protein